MYEIKRYHECEKPDMILEVVTETETVGIWPFRKNVEKQTTFYEDRTAKWSCPACKSQWKYLPALGNLTRKGWWRAESRTYTWEKVDH